MLDQTSPLHLRLSAQRALLGHVPPSLRAVSVELNGTTIRFRIVFDGTPDEEATDLLSCAATEMIADFTAPYTIEEECLAVDAPDAMTHLEWLVYLRHESDPSHDGPNNGLHRSSRS
jgi:hypothetical protein